MKKIKIKTIIKKKKTFGLRDPSLGYILGGGGGVARLFHFPFFLQDLSLFYLVLKAHYNVNFISTRQRFHFDRID